MYSADESEETSSVLDSDSVLELKSSPLQCTLLSELELCCKYFIMMVAVTNVPILTVAPIVLVTQQEAMFPKSKRCGSCPI